jgi:dihydrodipicolinate synthase/N-acetylneuraminate lyase
MGTCCLPWQAGYTLDESLLRLSINHLAETGTRHLYIFGTAGEGHAVSAKQFQQVTRVFADEMRRRGLEPMVGVISLSLHEVLDRIAWAGGLGVSRFQVSLPSWGTCTEAEAFSFFEQVCARFPNFQFLHYDLKRAGRRLSAAEYGRIAEAFPNLVAAKLAGSTGVEAAAVQEAAPELRLFLTEKAFADAGPLGVEAGLLISYASLHWERARAFYDAVVEDDRPAVAEHRAEQVGVLNLLKSSVEDGPHMDGAFDMMFLKKALPGFPLRLLPPYAAASDTSFDRFIAQMKRQYPAWMERD